MYCTAWWFAKTVIFYPTNWDDVLPIDFLIFFDGMAQPPTSKHVKLSKNDPK